MEDQTPPIPAPKLLPEQTPEPLLKPAAQQARETRQAAALRANLRRRKTQARARAEAQSEPEAAAPPPEPDAVP